MTVPTTRATADLWTGLGPVPENLQGFFDQALLDALPPEFIFMGYGMRRNLPPNQGRTINWERPNLLTVSTAQIPEYETPVGQQFSTSHVSATVGEYGTHVPFSRRADGISLIKDLTGKIRDVLAIHKKDTFDQLTRDGLVAGTSCIQTTGTTRAEVADNLTKANLNDAIEYLVGNNAKPITKRVEPSTGVGTRALNPAFLAFGHEDLYTDIVAACKTTTDDWLDVADYPAGSQRLPNEVGTYRGRRNIRFILSNNGKVWEGTGDGTTTGHRYTGSNIDVYGLVILSENAYIESAINGKDLGVVVQPLGSSGSADPFKQRGTIAWAAHFAATICDDARITRIECGCSV